MAVLGPDRRQQFLQLAVAAAIALFGFESRRSARRGGVLIEVPVMLIVAGIVNRSRAWYERDSEPAGNGDRLAAVGGSSAADRLSHRLRSAAAMLLNST